MNARGRVQGTGREHGRTSEQADICEDTIVERNRRADDGVRGEEGRSFVRSHGE